MVTIAIEVFSILIASSLLFIVLGLAKKVGVMIGVGGMFMLLIAVSTDTIILGKIPTTSVVSGSTTTYTFINNTFDFTQLHKLLLSLISVTIILMGFLYWRSDKK